MWEKGTSRPWLDIVRSFYKLLSKTSTCFLPTTQLLSIWRFPEAAWQQLWQRERAHCPQDFRHFCPMSSLFLDQPSPHCPGEFWWLREVFVFANHWETASTGVLGPGLTLWLLHHVSPLKTTNRDKWLQAARLLLPCKKHTLYLKSTKR